VRSDDEGEVFQMKNYVKVVVMSKNVDVFTFEDQDEASTKAALLSAAAVAKPCKGRVVVWAVSGMVPKDTQVVGRALDWSPSPVLS
jgi:hypothetical protein